MPFETESETFGYDGGVNNVQLCAYRPSTNELIKSTTIDSDYSNSQLPQQQPQQQQQQQHSTSSLPPPPPTTTITTTTTVQQVAVEVNRVYLSYGRGNSIKPVLNYISLNVPEAAIYGLLGPSGCGKTTLLRCIVGRIKAQQGYVRVFGYHPNEPGSQIPGPSVGYMPQEVAVYDEFSIEEMLYYFGRLFNLNPEFLNERILFLITFLDLPNKNRLVKHLSGGQKRRVSLAAALVHSPPLLILDEPTVGVDPLLRQSIWNHLVTLTRKERITVIVTTHYIEEARQANVVGLMRQGILLAENTPDQLMIEHNLDTLEDVFLKLCMSDISFKAAQLSNYTTIPNLNLNSNSNGHIIQQQHHHQQQPYEETSINNNSNNINHHSNNTNNNHTNLTAKQFEQIEANGDLKNIIKFPSVFSLYVTKQEASYDLSSSSSATSSPSSTTVTSSPVKTNQSSLMNPSIIHSTNNSTINLVTAENGHYCHSKMNDHTTMTNENNIKNIIQMNGIMNGHLPSSAPPPPPSSTTKKITIYQSYQNHMGKQNRNSCKLSKWNEYWSITSIVAWKNFTRLRRNIPLLLFQFLLPAIQVILFCLCIGGEPFDIDVAVVNEEQPPYLSKLFLSKIDPVSVRQHNFSSLEDAIAAVKRGEMWGVLHLSEKFSVNLQKRVVMGEDVDNETIEASTVRIYPDLTNQQISFSMEKTFREAFQAFAQETLNLFGQNPALAETPIALGFPIYGDPHKQGYLEYMAPGVVVSICYIMATGLTSLAFIIERRDGLFERSLVAGVDTMQILFSHALVQISVMSIQILLVLIFTFLVFDIPSRGPFLLVILLLVFQGATGMAFGLVVSALCKQENTAVMMILGSFYPNLILSGIIWPLEAMPHWIRSFSYFQPQTLPTETLRHILSRGWSIGDSGVWIGFFVTGSWFFIYVIIAAIVFKIKN